MISLRKYAQKRHTVVSTAAVVTILFVLSGCQMPAPPFTDDQVQAAAVGGEATGADVETEQEAESAEAPMSHMAASSDGHRAELDMESPIELDPSRGQEIGAVFEAFLSPHQEGGEEEDTPALTPSQFKSTAPSVSRNERPSHGHGVLSFTNDLSSAYVHVAIEGVKTEDIVMFHIHCGRPGQLGPIIVDFALAGDLQEYWADDILALEVTNEDILAATAHGEGLVGAFTAGCPIVAGVPLDKVKTISGMETIARKGELYFNLHTKGQTFFGDIRGKLQLVER
ncbi:MAG: CHRD domain-containing protein [Chloroflexota bacterium]